MLENTGLFIFCSLPGSAFHLHNKYTISFETVSGFCFSHSNKIFDLVSEAAVTYWYDSFMIAGSDQIILADNGNVCYRQYYNTSCGSGRLHQWHTDQLFPLDTARSNIAVMVSLVEFHTAGTARTHLIFWTQWMTFKIRHIQTPTDLVILWIWALNYFLWRKRNMFSD